MKKRIYGKWVGNLSDVPEQNSTPNVYYIDDWQCPECGSYNVELIDGKHICWECDYEWQESEE